MTLFICAKQQNETTKDLQMFFFGICNLSIMQHCILSITQWFFNE